MLSGVCCLGYYSRLCGLVCFRGLGGFVCFLSRSALGTKTYTVADAKGLLRSYNNNGPRRRKPDSRGLRITKAQTSLRIRAV